MTKYKNTKLNNLEQQITITRKELNLLWAAQGCTDAVVLATAAELDELCNEYQRLIQEPQTTTRRRNSGP